MRNPLDRRIPRELRANLGKYLGIFALLFLISAMVTGYMVAASSLQATIEGMRDAYIVEDLQFDCDFEAPRKAVRAVEALGMTVHENFYRDLTMGWKGSSGEERAGTVRVMRIRSDFDLPVYVEGEEPGSRGQIALDRTFCENNGLGVGDHVTVGGRDFSISGIMTLSDYPTQMVHNSDLMYNIQSFSVSQVSDEDFDQLVGSSAQWRYSAVLDDRSMALPQRVELERKVAEAVSQNGASLSSIVDRESNQAISFSQDDVVHDQGMWEVMLVLLVLIMAFVFVVLTNATIEEQSSAIGTLLASGWRRSEILRHYLTLPVLVGTVACVVGNAVGYAFLIKPMASLYMRSYSLPPYVVTFQPRVFVMTTLLPLGLLVLITFFGLLRKLGATPLAFLRHETSHRKGFGRVRLPSSWGFALRFRTRIFLRNISQFVILFLGVSVGSILLLMGLIMLPTVEHVARTMSQSVAAQHVYLLKAPLRLDGSPEERAAFEAAETLSTSSAEDIQALDPAALLGLAIRAQTVNPDDRAVNVRENSPELIGQTERFAAASLEVKRNLTDSMEQITLYGIEEPSRYWSDVQLSHGGIVVGKGLSQKCDLRVGQTYPFIDRFEGKAYDLRVDGITGGDANMDAYLSRADFCALMGEPGDYFNGYASDEDLDLDPRFVAKEITPQDMLKAVGQIRESMGDIMNTMVALAVPFYLVVMYLLTKTVIDRSARSISYMKVFGYQDGEVARLYIRSITTAVALTLVLSLGGIIELFKLIMKFMMVSYSGNWTLWYTPLHLVELVAIGFATYGVVALIHLRNIRRVSLSEALKVQE